MVHPNTLIALDKSRQRAVESSLRVRRERAAALKRHQELARLKRLEEEKKVIKELKSMTCGGFDMKAYLPLSKHHLNVVIQKVFCYNI
jgi:hypothetical protein